MLPVYRILRGYGTERDPKTYLVWDLKLMKAMEIITWQLSATNKMTIAFSNKKFWSAKNWFIPTLTNFSSYTKFNKH